MKRKERIMRDCMHKVATSLRFDSWSELNRLKNQSVRSKHYKMAEAIYLVEMPILFCNWYCAKIWQGQSVRRTIQKQDLEEFLNQEV